MKPKLRALLLLFGGGAVLAFAVQGGEFGTTDLFSQHARKQRLRAEIDSLRRAVDSLTSYKRALVTDRALQERIAREEFGMVRGEKEILYRFAEPGKTARDTLVPSPQERSP